MSATPVDVVLVTGAAHRLGALIAEHFARAGHPVALHCHRSIEAAERLASRLRAEHDTSAMVVQQDLALHGAAERIVRTVESAGHRIRFLVNNASTWPAANLDDTDEALLDAIHAVNVRAPFQLMRHAHRAGSLQAVVNLLDCRSQRAWPGRGAYVASRTALESLTRSAAVEWAGMVRVNGVAVGPTLLPENASAEIQEAVLHKMPQGRLVDPEEVAEIVFRLAAGGFESVTGAIWTIDGARHLVG
ncbi:MAG: SDR family oxidoreductase [Deltaproteobacteria bacterium]|nr:MAG: SDR family oxidoreductase [Deltaproteobacteria bacterium]